MCSSTLQAQASLHSSRAELASGRSHGVRRGSAILAAIRTEVIDGVSIGTAFHPRTSPLNRKMQWREWSGYFAASAYADAPDIEYNAIREAAALIDVSPLYKYEVTGPDALRFVDRVIVRDATKLQPNQVWYACWCDEH